MKSPTQNLFSNNLNQQLKSSIVGTDKDIYSLTLDLTTARTEAGAYEVNVPFRGFFLISIVHATTGAISIDQEVKIKLEKNVKGADYLIGGMGYSYSSDSAYSKAYIWHDALSGYVLNIQFFKNGIIKQGVSKINTTTFDVLPSYIQTNNPALGATSATLVSAYAAYKRSMAIQNNTGATVYAGDSTVTDTGATKGLEIINGATLMLTGRSAVYVYSVSARAAGLLTVLEERF